ncbi:hypothetical protein KGP93_41515, partial [Burkholderia multivorans]|nr:hypothetical protein [Burkholderia multivorans]
MPNTSDVTTLRKIDEISIQDLKAVSGAVGPAGAIFGGLASGASYLGQASVTGQGNPGGFASAILAGAAFGFFTGSATPTLMQAG